MSIELVMPSNHLILCCPLLLLPLIFPSIRVFSFFYFLFFYFYFLNFKIFNSYMRSQTWTPLPPPSPQHLSGSSIRVFSNESVLHIRWPKYWSFSFNISPPMNTQDWSLGWTGWTSLQSKGFSRVFSNNTVRKHQFFGAQPSVWSNSHTHTWLMEKP